MLSVIHLLYYSILWNCLLRGFSQWRRDWRSLGEKTQPLERQLEEGQTCFHLFKPTFYICNSVIPGTKMKEKGICAKSIVKIKDKSIVKIKDKSIVKIKDKSIVKIKDKSIVKIKDNSIVKIKDKTIVKIKDKNIIKIKRKTHRSKLKGSGLCCKKLRRLQRCPNSCKFDSYFRISVYSAINEFCP